ncbi:hypothetical protein JIM95_006700 [Corynebacterium sp. CCM 8835]|uniref:Secreted protein n=1 Tax=Corynebacterium antarcticum TaxID=2800405 RepID=A0ABS1FHZ5_9CORY|nr:hypothetical protein [Corynebacterium antarcticum]MCK7642236.1 hypothetical protein [Corynebacterium antarcticum]MCK7661080.1 hypothetical protein [Corynebacterium antarcticum]MCL0245828.1 hypothetical protein [Corynebacterium antarcticum]MCX7491715.1 hypothetical protein [Corynebacterium antarcticum]
MNQAINQVLKWVFYGVSGIGAIFVLLCLKDGDIVMALLVAAIFGGMALKARTAYEATIPAEGVDDRFEGTTFMSLAKKYELVEFYEETSLTFDEVSEAAEESADVLRKSGIKLDRVGESDESIWYELSDIVGTGLDRYRIDYAATSPGRATVTFTVEEYSYVRQMMFLVIPASGQLPTQSFKLSQRFTTSLRRRLSPGVTAD